MPAVFIPPIVYDLPRILPETTGVQYRLFRHYSPLPRGRTVLGIADGGLNLLSTEQMSMEGGITGWEVVANCTLSQSSAQAQHGSSSLAMTSTATGTIVARTTAVAVSPSTQYTALLSLWTPAAGHLPQLVVYWYGADETTVVGTSTSSEPNAGGWSSHTVTATSPATAYYASVAALFQNTTSGQVYHADKASLRPGAGTSWTLTPLAYSTWDNPDQFTVASAAEVYLGGHEYVISDEVADALIAAGYGLLVADIWDSLSSTEWGELAPGYWAGV